ncbi:unnamed protein product [Moneuplotes crassus]|uniref:Uncharacterized protein n=1 Tax=Euplotes crassus TaxID=5936 RepID=A0AAD1UQ78_EUPCR|nr:unnamed protein product [Moneuplotes crassus]
MLNTSLLSCINQFLILKSKRQNFKEKNSPSPHHRSVNGRKSLPNSEAEREFRMSSSFMTPKREDMKQKYFLETYNGSPGLIRYKGESPNDLYGQPYQESSLQNFKQKSKIGNIAVPSESDLKLRSSVCQKIEFEKLKEQLALSQEARDTLRFIGKRERILKHGWKDGVSGYELPKIIRTKKLQENTINKSYNEFLSKDLNESKEGYITNNMFGHAVKEKNRRTRRLKNLFGSSEAIEFNNEQTSKRSVDSENSHSPLWNKKKQYLDNPNYPKDTHTRIFVPQICIPRAGRKVKFA